MPSKNKTELLKLNQWQENEYPKMDDFNDDNKKLDDAYKSIVNKLNDKAEKSYVDDKINDIDFTTLENEIDKKANEIHTHSANDITETTSKKFVTSSQLSNIDTITDKANKIHNHSANDITETYSKKFVTTSEKLKIKDIDGKADQEHTHSARDISETTSRNFVSDTQLSNINKITEKADKFYVDNQIITSTSDTGIKSVNNSNALLASTDARAQGGNAGVYSSRAAETNSITSAVIGSWKSQIKDTDPKYLRNTVMLASNEFEFDPSSANDNKVVGGYKGNLSWMLDSRNGEIYAKNDVYTDMKSLNSLSKSSTIVIANYDSHENSKKGADILINKGENAAEKINDAIQSLKRIGGEVKLMEGKYQLNSKISILVDNITLTGVGKATELIASNLPSGSRGSLIEVGEDLNTNNRQVRGVTVSNLIINGNNTTENYRGIGLWGAINSTISNVVCSNNRLDGIQLSNNSSATISNVKCSSNNTNGIGMFDNSSATISNVECSSNNTNGIQLSNNSSATISSVECSNNGAHGIGMFNNSSATISNNTSYNNGGNYCDIAVRGGSHIITNNFLGTTNNTSGWGIYIWGDSVNSVVANNILIDDYKKAMVVDNGKNTITELIGNVGV